MNFDEIELSDECIKFQKRLFSYAVTLCYDREMAKDLVQDVFMKAWDRKIKKRGEEFVNWGFAVIKHTYIDICRNKSTERRYLNSFTSSVFETYNEPKKEARERIAKITKLLKKEYPQYVEVFLLRKLGIKLREIAEINNEDINTIKGRIYRMKKVIQTIKLQL